MCGWGGVGGVAKVHGKLAVPGRPTTSDNSRARALAAGACRGCLDIVSLVCLFCFFSPSLGDGPI